MNVRPGDGHTERPAVRLDEHALLGPGLAAVGRIRSLLSLSNRDLPSTQSAACHVQLTLPNSSHSRRSSAQSGEAATGTEITTYFAVGLIASRFFPAPGPEKIAGMTWWTRERRPSAEVEAQMRAKREQVVEEEG